LIFKVIKDSVELSFIYIAPNHNNSHLKVLYIVRQRTYNSRDKTETIKQPLLSKQSATTGRKNSHLTGRNLQQNQAKGGAAICCYWLRVMGGRQDKRCCGREPEINSN